MISPAIPTVRRAALSALLVAVILSTVAGVAMAAGLTARDYAYLKQHWGLEPSSPVAKALTPEEQAKLHELINDPGFRDYPLTIQRNVADYLFQIETCFTWVASHPADQPCPQEAARQQSPGRAVADRYCNACHLTGTADAPSFFALARRGDWDEARLAQAVKTGHRMSPISLSPQELRELADYIRSLRK